MRGSSRRRILCIGGGGVLTPGSWACFLLALCFPSPAAALQFQSVRLNGPLVHDVPGDVLDCQVSTDGAWVVYRCRPDAATGVEVYSAPADGSALPVQLSNQASDVTSYRIAPDASRVVF